MQQPCVHTCALTFCRYTWNSEKEDLSLKCYPLFGNFIVVNKDYLWRLLFLELFFFFFFFFLCGDRLSEWDLAEEQRGKLLLDPCILLSFHCFFFPQEPDLIKYKSHCRTISFWELTFSFSSSFQSFSFSSSLWAEGRDPHRRRGCKQKGHLCLHSGNVIWNVSQLGENHSL